MKIMKNHKEWNRMKEEAKRRKRMKEEAIDEMDGSQTQIFRLSFCGWKRELNEVVLLHY
jgi:hypothetical protein